MLVAWTDFLWQGGESYAGLVEGIHLSNRTLGVQVASTGHQPHQHHLHDHLFLRRLHGHTFLAGTFWHWMGWQGVVLTGVLLVACSLAITSCCRKAD